MGRAPCCSKVGLHRGPWTAKEDALLIKYIEAHGEGQWRSLPKKAGLLRCGKSCRLRWMNYLRPDIKRGNITPDEEDLIIRLHGLLGNRWSLIAGRLPGRTDNEIKNYWNTHLSKRLRSQGTDPNTHKKLPESELEKLANNNNKRGRSTSTTKGKAQKLNQIHKKEVLIANKNDTNNGREERERTKIHLPKPIRVTSIIPLTRSDSNGSCETNVSTTSASPSQSQSQSQLENHGFTLFDQDNVMLDDVPWLSNNDASIMDDDGHGHGLDQLIMMMDVIQPYGSHDQDDVCWYLPGTIKFD
ncbi:hypothetical protein Cgig2_030369 [Carnegiea gigantea]|uniref:Uncharacterized protein n=1 Tax=Carnegiea gigantea TaxID=171969 RepID=A0A9Q1KJG1_9CARY|nr:hypothetical protein Cgig2_030369 [Carnegiea gigantea]